MKRTSLSLPDDLALALEREAQRRRTTMSAVARTALASHLGLDASEERSLGFAALGRSGGRSTGRDMEALLTEEWRDARDR